MSDYIPDLTERYPEGYRTEDRDPEYEAWSAYADSIDRERKALKDAGIDPDALDRNYKYDWDGHKTIPNPNYDPVLAAKAEAVLRTVRYTKGAKA